MPKLYAFDVDETLEISNGPIKLQSLMDLRLQGHIVGICGNFNLFCRIPGWQHLVSFVGQGVLQKHDFLRMIANNIPHDERIMVGNVFGEDNGMGWLGGSRDSEAAKLVDWRFIKEIDFARGVR